MHTLFSINVLFESAATTYRNHVAAILLNRANNDCAGGLIRIRVFGGLAVVQTLVMVKYPVMPEVGLESVEDAIVLMPRQMPHRITKRVITNCRIEAIHGA